MQISNTYLGNIPCSWNADPLRLKRTNSKQQGTRPRRAIGYGGGLCLLSQSLAGTLNDAGIDYEGEAALRAG